MSLNYKISFNYVVRGNKTKIIYVIENSKRELKETLKPTHLFMPNLYLTALCKSSSSQVKFQVNRSYKNLTYSIFCFKFSSIH